MSKDTDQLWYNNFTREHYEAATSYLENLDEVMCVKTHNGRAYRSGELWIHTEYLLTEIVEKLINLLDMQIRQISVATPNEDPAFDCMYRHGKCIEINMEVKSNCNPVPSEEFMDFTEDFELNVTDKDKEVSKIF